MKWGTKLITSYQFATHRTISMLSGFHEGRSHKCFSDILSYVCAPEHISLVICVSRVGKHKTLKLGIQAFKWDNNIENKMAIVCVEIPAGSVVFTNITTKEP